MSIIYFRLLALEAGRRRLCQTRTMSNELLEKLNRRHENYETFFVYLCDYFMHFQTQCFPLSPLFSLFYSIFSVLLLLFFHLIFTFPFVPP